MKKIELIELIDGIEFDYKINNDGTLSLVDMQNANLGNIESETFEVDKELALCLIDRLETYIYDYYVSGYIRTLQDECNENLELEDWESILEKMKKYPQVFSDSINFMEAIVNPELFDIEDILEKSAKIKNSIMYERYQSEIEDSELIETYKNAKEVIEDATRYYREHFTMDDDYNQDFEVKSFSQAQDFWEANGYDIKIKRKPGTCPICGSDKITVDGSDISETHYFYRCICDDCNTTYNESYKLVFENFVDIIEAKPSHINDFTCNV